MAKAQSKSCIPSTHYLLDNIEQVRGYYGGTDTFVVTNPAWNKRISELENCDTLSGTPEWANGFVTYMEDELNKLNEMHGYPIDCDVSDPKLGRKSDRYYFEVIWF